MTTSASANSPSPSPLRAAATSTSTPAGAVSGPPPVHHHHHHHHHPHHSQRQDQHTHASPMRKPKALHLPTTPATSTSSTLSADRALYQPSPNRTEAAAAMMHLFSSSTSDADDRIKIEGRLPVHPPVPAIKAKRKYVRKASRKPTLAAKKLAKIAEDPKEDSACDTPASQGSDLGPDDDTENTKDNGEDVRFFPFREYNRKEKSLGLLCENFLKLYRADQVTEICLDRAAMQLGVERRRIYDIVNILESIHLVSRKSKNLYNWHGLNALPVSITAMRKKYAEQEQLNEDGPLNLDSNMKVDRRRGKSLSKLSQMFVQLFLIKENSIIPLDQAAKQLIQLEESENEEERLLKTKIRRLYDVANVLVSVGLIEKLQLSNSRKPVFRWRNRASMPGVGESMLEMEIVNRPLPSAMSEKEKSSESEYSSRTIKDIEGLKSSQSCESDHSDSCDSSSEIRIKRQRDDLEQANDDTEAKRIKVESPEPTPTRQSHTSTTNPLLRFDQNNLPVHPQIILQEQQLSVKQFMHQYIREYVDYFIMHQVRLDPLALNASPSPQTESTEASSSKTEANNAIVAHPSPSVGPDVHRTPINIPSIANRVTQDLAGSIHEILFSSTTTSPQSVADLFRVDARVVTKTLDAGLSTPSPELLHRKDLTSDPSPIALERIRQDTTDGTTTIKTMSSPSSSQGSSSGDDEGFQSQARRLFTMNVAPPTPSTQAPSAPTGDRS